MNKPDVPSFTLTSTDVVQLRPLAAAQLATRIGGGGVSPQLSWSGFPPQTRGFALTCLDPDAPGGNYWHWGMANIPLSVTSLAAGAKAPAGAVVLTSDGGIPGYEGAGPPKGHGLHHYHFEVYALDVPRLDVPATAGCADLAAMLSAHTLARAGIVGTCQR